MSSQKPIAVGTNDSAQSQAAVLWAARRAHRANVPLVILHVVDDRWIAEPYPWFGTLQQAGEELLKTAAGRLEGSVPITPATEMLTGSVGGSLAKYSKRASMMVMGSGSGHLGGALADRALQVATAAKVPVAVVGTQDLEGSTGVVVGVDGSPQATQAVAFAAAEADRDGDELTVVYAVNVPNPIVDAGLTPSAVADLIVDEERVVLSETVAGLKEDYPDLTVHQRLVTDRDPVDALVDAAAGARLLVVGSRGRGAFKRLLLGSTAHGVLKHLPCPTIITRTQVAKDMI